MIAPEAVFCGAGSRSGPLRYLVVEWI